MYYLINTFWEGIRDKPDGNISDMQKIYFASKDP